MSTYTCQPMTDEEFARAIAAIYAKLLAEQAPLDSEFDRVWVNNTEKLYEF